MLVFNSFLFQDPRNSVLMRFICFHDYVVELLVLVLVCVSIFIAVVYYNRKMFTFGYEHQVVEFL